MAGFDSKGNVLGANGRWKIIIAAAGTPVVGQILPPTGLKSTDAPADGTLNVAGGDTSLPAKTVRPARVCAGAGTGAVTLYDANSAANATAAQIIWSTTGIGNGASVPIDTPCVGGLWISVGANTTVTVVFS